MEGRKKIENNKFREEESKKKEHKSERKSSKETRTAVGNKIIKKKGVKGFLAAEENIERETATPFSATSFCLSTSET